mmetsp:Transcript_15565/g.51785  ORF Transcript_15565/g.51785 Transcript_15565/m.51785 type:complete len:372 (-) Transcript_15565:2322-3437(-)
MDSPRGQAAGQRRLHRDVGRAVGCLVRRGCARELRAGARGGLLSFDLDGPAAQRVPALPRRRAPPPVRLGPRDAAATAAPPRHRRSCGAGSRGRPARECGAPRRGAPQERVAVRDAPAAAARRRCRGGRLRPRAGLRRGGRFGRVGAAACGAVDRGRPARAVRCRVPQGGCTAPRGRARRRPALPRRRPAPLAHRGRGQAGDGQVLRAGPRHAGAAALLGLGHGGGRQRGGRGDCREPPQAGRRGSAGAFARRSLKRLNTRVESGWLRRRRCGVACDACVGRQAHAPRSADGARQGQVTQRGPRAYICTDATLLSALWNSCHMRTLKTDFRRPPAPARLRGHGGRGEPAERAHTTVLHSLLRKKGMAPKSP